MRVSIGVLADTHIPDRTRRLHPKVIPTFQKAGVKVILHAGDISARSVLQELSQVAAVYAVRGNRDWLLNHLPFSRQLFFHGVKIALTHGHGNLWDYLSGHVQNILAGGNDIEVYHSRLNAAFPDAQVIIYGHLHQPVNQWRAGQLLFNPGSPHFPGQKTTSPTIGLLHITENKKVESEIVSLN